MGKIRDFKIIIDKNKAAEHVFKPGDIVCGIVMVHLNEPLKISKLEVEICGSTTVNEHGKDNRACEDDDDDDNDEAKKSEDFEEVNPEDCDSDVEEEPEQYEATDWHFRDNQVLWGVRGTKKKMPIGRNEIRFEFKLSQEPLPTTFESSMGFTRYWLEASLEPSRIEFNKKAKLPFTIVDSTNAFSDEKYLESVTTESKTSRWFLCCPRQSHVNCSLTVDRSVYSPGDSILYSGEIMNNTHEIVTGQICIYQRVNYHMKTSTKSEERIVECKAMNDIYELETKTWTNTSMMIPPVPPTSSTKLISIQYVMEMKLNVGANERTLSTPIYIASAQVKHTKSFGGYNYYRGPVPNYGKSVFGRTLLQDDNAYEPISYTPMYCYYPPIGI